MPPKSKKESKNTSKTKSEPKPQVVEITDTQCATLKIKSFEVEVNRAYTAVCLLESPEDEVVALSLFTLDELLQRNEQIGLLCLEKRNLLIRLLNVLERNAVIVKLSLKILIRLIRKPENINKIQSNVEHFTPIINAYLMNTDPIALEYAAFVLNIVCNTEEYAKHLCKLELIDKLFKDIVLIQVMDVKYNNLKVLFRIVSCYEQRFLIASAEEFKISILNLILHKKSLEDLQYVILDIICIITSWEVPEMILKLHETGTLAVLFTLFEVDSWSNLQNNVLTAIHNIIKYTTVQTKNLESLDFLSFIQFCRNATPEHGLACCALIAEFSKEKENRQVLFDLGVIDVLLDLCHYDCDLTSVKFCQILCELCQSCYITEKLLNRNILQRISAVMYKRYLPWDPYREVGIIPLYHFSLINPRLGLDLFQTDILKYLIEALLSRNYISKSNFKLIMYLYNILFHTKPLRKYMLTKEVFQMFLNMCQTKDEDKDIVRIILDVFISSMIDKEYRQWFIELRGVTIFMSMIIERNRHYIVKLVTFLKLSCRYREIAFVFLVHGIVPLLRSRMNYNIKKIALYKDIITDIYRNDASAKFQDFDYLDINDTIENGFAAFIGSKTKLFPPKLSNKLNTSFTVLTLNFDENVEEIVPLCQKPEEDDNISIASGEDYSITLKNILDLYVDLSNETIAKNVREDLYLLKVPLPLKKQQADYNLSVLLSKVIEKIDPIHDFLERVKALATFVHIHLSGYVKNYPKRHQYETHINELKSKLRSNYIPIGLIKIGQKAERAILFKAFADKLKIPCTLQRSDRYCIWNEIPVYHDDDFNGLYMEDNVLQYFIVDLMKNIGNLIPKNTPRAERYCEKCLIGDIYWDTNNSDSYSEITLDSTLIGEEEVDHAHHVTHVDHSPKQIERILLPIKIHSQDESFVESFQTFEIVI